MPDYKRAFEILKDKLKFNIFQKFYDDNFQKHDNYIDTIENVEILTDNEYDCIKDCLNSEPDTMDKIIEEFKKLGWKLETSTNYNVIFKNDYFDCKLWVDKEDKYITWDGITILSVTELNLITRIYRLWGVEV